MRKLYYFVPVLLISCLLHADGTRTWEQSSYDEFEKGTAKGVAIHSDGHLELAPPLKAISTTPSTFLWALAADASGDIYAAAGAPARVYRITPQGQVSIVFEPQELQVQSLLVDKDGTLYAATSPDGKVYKIVRKQGVSFPNPPPPAKKDVSTEAEIPKNVPVDSAYTATVFFEPKTKYIWNLAEDSRGRIYVATGDTGEIFRVEKNGTGTLFFKSEEAHIRALAVDGKDNLIAGSDGSGLIYRISPSGDAFVLYSATKKEITALAVDPDGTIYAAGVGEKHTGAPTTIAPLPNSAPPATAAASTGAPNAGAPRPGPVLPFTIMGGSEIYRIATDGSPKRLWSSRDDLVYALGFDRQHHLLAGTGNTGRIFTVLDDDTFVDIGKVSATQVTSMIQAPGGGLYLGTSNLGKIFELGGSAANDGSYESDVFDARIFSHWGRSAIRGTGAFDLYARSGNVDNPDRNWSAWSKVDLSKDTPLGVPPARFLQWKVVLHPSSPAPKVDSVLVNYLSKNVAPEISDVYVQTGARFPVVPKNAVENLPVSVGPSAGAAAQRFDIPAVAVRDRDSIAVRWNAHDDNDDSLVYSIYYRGEGETAWELLKGDLTDKYYSFDANLLPDGGYTLKVVASDAPSHSADEALTASKQSSYFEIDNTPPQVVDLNGAYAAGTIHLTFRAVDGFSPIQHAEYSVDAGDWHAIEPVGQISDYRVENYDLSIAPPGALSQDDTTVASAQTARQQIVVKAIKKVPASQTGAPELAPQEHVVIVRVYDRFDNMGSAKTVIHSK
jgi:sugar lactone lactonase YvrE